MKTTTIDDDPSSPKPASCYEVGHKDIENDKGKAGILSYLKTLISKPKNNDRREAIEEFIEELDEKDALSPSVAAHEKSLISNVLKLRDTTVIDVMIPRADIAAIDVSADKESLMQLLAEHQFSRIPVYKETLDDVLGSIHIKAVSYTHLTLPTTPYV